ncbi:carbonyl reductase [NADPH] 3-like [Heterocephalus glaber]|uniref:Carbonyl reductase [NADPH] 3-like n=2 Tax=Heterocephalus glaber TaxID=10181 RepID=A0AAX6SV77_HETGA|nr:carbonyl reductase [NADPH] 3-like [Heterocephalus glaber]
MLKVNILKLCTHRVSEEPRRRGRGLSLCSKAWTVLKIPDPHPMHFGPRASAGSSLPHSAQRCFPAMSSIRRVALVTGANKGIGFTIIRELCQGFSGDVVLTARDEARGRAVVQQLQAEGLSPRFHQLDIDDLQSIGA